MNVSECMSREVKICSPQDTLRQAASAMKDNDTGALPVGENDRLVGMITDRDIVVRAVAEGKSFEAPVREAMTDDLQYAYEDEDLDDVSVRMSDMKVRRLPVISRDKRLVGMISLGDISKSDDASRGSAALSGVANPGGPHAQA